MKFLGEKDLDDRGLGSRTTRWRLEKAGRFPRRVRISPGRIGWLESEIDAHQARLVAARDEVAS